MPRRKTLNRAVKSKVISNKKSAECDSSSDEESNTSLGILEMLLALQKRARQKKSKRKTPKKSKRQGANYALMEDFRSNSPKHCNCKKKKNCREPKASTSTINLESDEEKVNENIGDSHLKNIENKIDNFFKSANLTSDEEYENVNVVEGDPIPKKPKDFYTVISDSDDSDVEKPSTSAHIIPGASDVQNTSRDNAVAEENNDELMDIVDSILLPNDEFQKVPNIPDDNWEEYKKKTEEMLGSVSVLIHDLNENNNKVDEPPVPVPLKEVPSCPVCLETLGEKEAAVTFCGHMFCKACITCVAKTTKKCPTCRKSLNLKKIHPLYF